MSQNYNQWPPKCVCFIFLCPLQPLKKINLAISTHNKRMCTWAVYFPTLLCSRIWFNYVAPFKRHKDAYASIKSKKPQPKGCVSLQDHAQDAYQFSAARLPTVVYGSLSDCSGTLHIHGGTNELSKLATYHNDMKTFRQISPLPSWFCPSWRQAKWDIRFKRILRRTFGRNALRTKKNSLTVSFHLKLIERVSSDILFTHSLICSIAVAQHPVENSNQPSLEEPCHVYIFFISSNGTDCPSTCPLKKTYTSSDVYKPNVHVGW